MKVDVQCRALDQSGQWQRHGLKAFSCAGERTCQLGWKKAGCWVFFVCSGRRSLGKAQVTWWTLRCLGLRMAARMHRKVDLWGVAKEGQWVSQGRLKLDRFEWSGQDSLSKRLKMAKMMDLIVRNLESGWEIAAGAADQTGREGRRAVTAQMEVAAEAAPMLGPHQIGTEKVLDSRTTWSKPDFG